MQYSIQHDKLSVADSGNEARQTQTDHMLRLHTDGKEKTVVPMGRRLEETIGSARLAEVGYALPLCEWSAMPD